MLSEPIAFSDVDWSVVPDEPGVYVTPPITRLHPSLATQSFEEEAE
jgi:hypothetical protein